MEAPDLEARCTWPPTGAESASPGAPRTRLLLECRQSRVRSKRLVLPDLLPATRLLCEVSLPVSRTESHANPAVLFGPPLPPDGHPREMRYRLASKPLR